MIQLQYRSAHAKVVEDLLNAQRANSRLLARQCEAILTEGNRIDRLRGMDRTGKALRPWRWRVGRYERATGPALAPFGELSRAISSFFAEATKAAGGWTLTAGFRGKGVEFLGYHAAGKSGKGVPIRHDGKVVGFRGVRGRSTGIVRDVFGVSPGTYRSLQDEFKAFARDTFARRAYTAAKSVSRRAAVFFGGFFT